MSMPFSAATAAYGQAQRLISENARSAAAGPAMPAGNDFAQALAENVNSVVESGRVSDQKTMDMINGKGDVVDVVTAMAQTEFAIESVVTIRDRVISAYEEIMRMPI